MATTARFHKFGPFFSGGQLVTAPKIYHYLPGTSSLRDAYTSRAKSDTVAQPLVGDINGIASAYFDGLYKIVVKTANDVQLYSWDNWSAGPWDGTFISAEDYGASSAASAAANTAAINEAIADVNALGGGTVLLPDLYEVTNVGGNVAVTLLSNVHLRGIGRGASGLRLANGGEAHVINMSGVSHVAISHLTIDGNRANQTAGVHGIRSGGHTNLTIHDVQVKDTYTYGIGLQGGTQNGTILDMLFISGTGDDGIDIKNLEDDNTAAMLSNIWVSNPNQRAGSAKAGVDLRGPCVATNIHVTGLPANTIGIRFREGALLSASGYGAHKSSLTNFHVVCSSASGTYGVYVGAEHAKVCNGYVSGAQRGVEVTGPRGQVTSVLAEECTDGFTAVNDGAGLAADDTIFTACRAYRAAISASTRGFRVGTGTDGVAGVQILGCAADGFAEGVSVIAASSDARILNNDLTGNTAAISDAGTRTIKRNNAGYVTEASGTGTINSGATTAVITHGLSVTPTLKDISINFGEQGTNDYGRWWVSNLTSTQFTLNVSADPGASNLDFAWRAVVL